MNKANIKDYEDAISFVMEFVSEIPKNITPELVIHNGHIKSPGISDIDMVFVFKDEFVFSEYFLHLFSKKIEKLEHKSIFFYHQPHIFPLSAINDLPYMTYNPVSELKILKGQNDFSSENLDSYQNMLNSYEQIHNRIITLIKLKSTDNKNIHSLLLTGHSMVHTINCLNMLGAEFKIDNFENLLIIEKARKLLTIGEKNMPLNYDNLCSGLINEFFKLYNWLDSLFEKKIISHFSKEKDIYQYDNDVFFIKLNSGKKDLKFFTNNNNLFLEGFSWVSLLILENYFSNQSDFISIFSDNKLMEGINKRKKFLKKITNFNFRNFNSAVGRTGLHPLVRNNRYNWLARNLNAD
tara:strand:- start:5571 stop:6623 length:1053 start_codon:yes stop_codon:yes gene_type:complete